MKQIFCGFLALLTGIWVSACSAPEKPELGEQRIFRITHADSAGQMVSEIWTAPKLESLGSREISSEYFDRAMHMSDSRFSAISFSRFVKGFALKRGEDAVLLNCFDDYQGILSLDDVYRYDLRLATKIKTSSRPDWLNPLLILVPDGKRPPFQERFMTANIRELKFVRLNDYYAPLEKIAGDSPQVPRGIGSFQKQLPVLPFLKRQGAAIKEYDSYRSTPLRLTQIEKGFWRTFQNFIIKTMQINRMLNSSSPRENWSVLSIIFCRLRIAGDQEKTFMNRHCEEPLAMKA